MAEFSPQEMEIIHLGITVVATGGAAFVGMLLGGFVGAWHRRVRRRRSYFEKQLQEFYTPLLTLHEEIKVYEHTDNPHKRAGDTEVEQAEAALPAFDKISEKDILEKEILPTYERMLDMFRENMWMVDDQTRSHYHTLFKFVYAWQRVRPDTLSEQPLAVFRRSENMLDPLYNSLQQHQHKLLKQLKKA